jgi:hypothetical protein
MNVRRAPVRAESCRSIRMSTRPASVIELPVPASATNVQRAAAVRQQPAVPGFWSSNSVRKIGAWTLPGVSILDEPRQGRRSRRPQLLTAGKPEVMLELARNVVKGR